MHHCVIWLEKAVAPHSSTLAWKIPWTEEPSGLQSIASLRVRHDWATSLSLFTFLHWRRKWQPTPVFLPGESQGRWQPGGLPSVGSHRVGHDRSDLAAAACNLAILLHLFLKKIFLRIGANSTTFPKETSDWFSFWLHGILNSGYLTERLLFSFQFPPRTMPLTLGLARAFLPDHLQV